MTFGVAITVLVLLFVMTIGDTRRALAESSMPEIQDDEEIFLDPELLVIDNPGDAQPTETEEPAPQPPGQPDPAETEQPLKTIKATEEPQEPPVTNKAKNVADNKESDVKSAAPKLSKEDEKRIAAMSGKLKTDNNGAPNGKEAAASGSGGDGVALQGVVNGRKMLSCPTWKLKVTQKNTVVVEITVNSEGAVTAANAVAGGTPNLRKECEKMALRSKWTKSEGSKPVKGKITFTIMPA